MPSILSLTTLKLPHLIDVSLLCEQWLSLCLLLKKLVPLWLGVWMWWRRFQNHCLCSLSYMWSFFVSFASLLFLCFHSHFLLWQECLPWCINFKKYVVMILVTVVVDVLVAIVVVLVVKVRHHWRWQSYNDGFSYWKEIQMYEKARSDECYIHKSFLHVLLIVSLFFPPHS